MIVTIHQPEYLPWMGFFDRIDKADVFIVLDDVGYQKNAFINRNRIKTVDGWKWITIPVKGRSPNKKINEVLIDNSKKWQESQLSVIKKSYENSPNFKKYYGFIEKALSQKWDSIADLDIYLIKKVNDFLGIEARIERSSLVKIKSEKTQRIADICKHFKADTYLSGYGGKDYMDMDLLEKEGIKVIFQEFNQPEYEQNFKELGFIQNMSIIDLLFNCGEKSIDIIKSATSL